jgi:hypothetical protein
LDRTAEVSGVLGVPLASSVGDCEVLGPDDLGPDDLGSDGGDLGPDDRGSAGGDGGGAAGWRHCRAPDGTPYVLHDSLLVADLDGQPTRVGWRVAGGIGGEIHIDASGGTDALARALAWRSGEWHRRHALAAALRDPAAAAIRDAEDDLDDV